ncbi:hypothetical protein C8F01DRAFT_1090603 [Mycena amicta]|nr:hypothetical protein C8F01DRAFT_1090603 [Mycena amicta]
MPTAQSLSVRLCRKPKVRFKNCYNPNLNPEPGFSSVSLPVVSPVLPTTSLPLSPSSPILPSSSLTLPRTSSVLSSSSTTSLPAATKSPVIKSAPKSSSSPSPSTTPSSAASVSTIAATIVSSIVGLAIAGLLVAFVLRRWNRQCRARARDSIVNFDAKAFRRSAHLLDDDARVSALASYGAVIETVSTWKPLDNDPSSPLPPPNPRFGSNSSRRLPCEPAFGVQRPERTYHHGGVHPYLYGAGLNASVTPAVAVASPVTVMYTHDTHPSFAQPPPTEYYGYSSVDTPLGTPVPSPGPGYAPAPMQMQMQMSQGYAPSVHSIHLMHSVQSLPQPYGGYPPEMHRQPQQSQNVNRFSPPSQMVQIQQHPGYEQQQHYSTDDAYGGM